MVAQTVPGNAASRAVMEKLGMVTREKRSTRACRTWSIAAPARGHNADRNLRRHREFSPPTDLHAQAESPRRLSDGGSGGTTRAGTSPPAHGANRRNHIAA